MILIPFFCTDVSSLFLSPAEASFLKNKPIEPNNYSTRRLGFQTCVQKIRSPKMPSTILKCSGSSINPHLVGHSQNLGGITDSSSFLTLFIHLTYLQALSLLPLKYLWNHSLFLPLSCNHTNPSLQQPLLPSTQQPLN